MKEQAVRTRNYRKFYALLGQIRCASDDLREKFKERLVGQFTGGRATRASEMSNSEFALMLGALESIVAENSPRAVELDRLRKRVIATIGAWLRGRGMTESVWTIKAIACRAARADDFNRIPSGKLRALYEEWRNKKAVSVEANAVMGEIESKLSICN